jgi:hypothetical protein
LAGKEYMFETTKAFAADRRNLYSTTNATAIVNKGRLDLFTRSNTVYISATYTLENVTESNASLDDRFIEDQRSGRRIQGSCSARPQTRLRCHAEEADLGDRL